MTTKEATLTAPRRWIQRIPLAALVTAVWQGSVLTHAWVLGHRMAAQAHRFEVHPPSPHARVLLLGDSTGVGVGSLRGSESLPGLLAAEFPHVQIINACSNGARVADTLNQLREHSGTGAPFDLVLVMVGGNDVLKLTPPRLLAAQADALLQELMPQARQVVWLGSADIGNAPALLPPLNWVFGWLCRRAMALLGNAVQARGADFIDFCAHAHTRTFMSEPNHYFAADGLHPSAASYRHCFEELKRKTPLGPLLACRAEGAVTVGHPV